VLQSIEHILSQEVLIQAHKPLTTEEVAILLQNLLQVPRHIVVLKVALRVVGPEAEVHGVNHEAVGDNLLLRVLLHLVNMPVTPLVKGNALVGSHHLL